MHPQLLEPKWSGDFFLILEAPLAPQGGSNYKTYLADVPLCSPSTTSGACHQMESAFLEPLIKQTIKDSYDPLDPLDP